MKLPLRETIIFILGMAHFTTSATDTEATSVIPEEESRDLRGKHHSHGGGKFNSTAWREKKCSKKLDEKGIVCGEMGEFKFSECDNYTFPTGHGHGGGGGGKWGNHTSSSGDSSSEDGNHTSSSGDSSSEDDSSEDDNNTTRALWVSENYEEDELSLEIYDYELLTAEEYDMMRELNDFLEGADLHLQEEGEDEVYDSTDNDGTEKRSLRKGRKRPHKWENGGGGGKWGNGGGKWGNSEGGILDGAEGGKLGSNEDGGKLDGGGGGKWGDFTTDEIKEIKIKRLVCKCCDS